MAAYVVAVLGAAGCGKSRFINQCLGADVVPSHPGGEDIKTCAVRVVHGAQTEIAVDRLAAVITVSSLLMPPGMVLIEIPSGKEAYFAPYVHAAACVVLVTARQACFDDAVRLRNLCHTNQVAVNFISLSDASDNPNSHKQSWRHVAHAGAGFVGADNVLVCEVMLTTTDLLQELTGFMLITNFAKQAARLRHQQPQQPPPQQQQQQPQPQPQPQQPQPPQPQPPQPQQPQQQQQESYFITAVEAPVRRGRGRPRKYPIGFKPPRPRAVTIEPLVHRPRGRPRKDAAAQQLLTTDDIVPRRAPPGCGPNICPMCGVGMTRASNLDRHMHNKHGVPL